MSGPLLLVSLLVGWAGTSMLLQQVRWVSRPSLTARLRPYVAGAGLAPAPVSGLRDEVLLWASEVAAWVARTTGSGDDVEHRLARVHAEEDVAGFRARQVGWAVGGMAAAAATAGLLRCGAPATVVFLLVGPAIGFLVPEQRLARRSEVWQQRVLLELPVVAEQLAMLLGAGWSLGAALQRLASRGSGAVSLDLERVGRRIRQGVTEEDALREWADLSGVLAVERLVGVLVMNRATSDLGRLVGEEARQIRRDDHRRLVVQVERRNQQVWIPVTVAALVPGVLFLAIPFVEALRAFGG